MFSRRWKMQKWCKSRDGCAHAAIILCASHISWRAGFVRNHHWEQSPCDQMEGRYLLNHAEFCQEPLWGDNGPQGLHSKWYASNDEWILPECFDLWCCRHLWCQVAMVPWSGSETCGLQWAELLQCHYCAHAATICMYRPHFMMGRICWKSPPRTITLPPNGRWLSVKSCRVLSRASRRWWWVTGTSFQIPNDEIRMTNNFCQSALTVDAADTCGIRLQWCLEAGVKPVAFSEQFALVCALLPRVNWSKRSYPCHLGNQWIPKNGENAAQHWGQHQPWYAVSQGAFPSTRQPSLA